MAATFPQSDRLRAHHGHCSSRRSYHGRVYDDRADPAPEVGRGRARNRRQRRRTCERPRGGKFHDADHRDPGRDLLHDKHHARHAEPSPRAGVLRRGSGLRAQERARAGFGARACASIAPGSENTEAFAGIRARAGCSSSRRAISAATAAIPIRAGLATRAAKHWLKTASFPFRPGERSITF